MERLMIENDYGRSFEHGEIDFERVNAHEQKITLSIEFTASAESPVEEIKKAFERLIKDFAI